VLPACHPHNALDIHPKNGHSHPQTQAHCSYVLMFFHSFFQINTILTILTLSAVHAQPSQIKKAPTKKMGIRHVRLPIIYYAAVLYRR